MSDLNACEVCGTTDAVLHHVGDDRFCWDCMDTRERIEHANDGCPCGQGAPK